MKVNGNIGAMAKLIFYKAFGKSYEAGFCGHKAKLFSKVRVFGKEILLEMQKGFAYCPECLAKMAIRCAWCGRFILPGDPITLYSPPDQDWIIPEYAVVYQKEPVVQLVGCMRLLCAEGAIDRTGFWVPPGRVFRVASPMELCMLTNNVVGCNDVDNINKAIPLDDLAGVATFAALINC